MSIATAVTGAIEEVRNATDEDVLARILDDSNYRADPEREDPESEDSEEVIQPTDQRAITLHLLKEELEDNNITLPERWISFFEL